MTGKKTKKRPGPLRGARRMREQGYKLVSVWLDQAEARIADELAGNGRIKLATFFRAAGVAAAKVHLEGEAMR